MKKRTTILMISLLALVMLSISSFGAQPIKGTITYHEDLTKPIPSVIVQLWQNGIQLDQTTTNINGKYIFPNVAYGNYTIKALNTPIEAGGVDGVDAQLILQHIATPFLTGIEFIAADVALPSGVVDMNDYNAVVAQMNCGFEPEWVFEDLPVTHTGTKDNVPTMGGSSSGDVNGTFVPTGRNEEIVPVSYFAKNFTSDFTVEVFAKEISNASAMSFVIDYPTTVDIIGVTSQMGTLAHIKIDNNRIIATWINENFESAEFKSNEPVLVINSKVNQSYNGSDIKFTIDNKTHFVNNGQAFKPEFSVPYLSVNNNDNLSLSYPNPASESTIIYFSLPQATNACLNIYNLNGQLIKNILNEEMSAGQHSVTVSVAELKEGVYFYNLVTSGNVNINQAKRLVVVH